jgi:hypothetical protein
MGDNRLQVSRGDRPGDRSRTGGQRQQVNRRIDKGHNGSQGIANARVEVDDQFPHSSDFPAPAR